MQEALARLLFLPEVGGSCSVLNPSQLDLPNALMIIAINRSILVNHILPITYGHRTVKTSFVRSALFE